MSNRLAPQELQNTLETLWNGLNDIPFTEDETGELILSKEYYIWEVGTSQTYIWSWFDARFEKPLGERM